MGGGQERAEDYQICVALTSVAPYLNVLAPH